MKINEMMQTALNEQINAEFHSAYLYLAMAAYFEHTNLHGMASWMKVQAKEELSHGMKLYGFIVERQGEVRLQTIANPATTWSSPLDAFKAAYNHEQGISARFDKLMELAQAQKDHATASFLRWFVDEQVEEEAAADGIVQSLMLIGESKGNLFMLDHQLGKRAQG